MLIAFAAPEHSAVPIVKAASSDRETVNGDIAYEHVQLRVTKTVKFGFVSLMYG